MCFDFVCHFYLQLFRTQGEIRELFLYNQVDLYVNFNFYPSLYKFEITEHNAEKVFDVEYYKSQCRPICAVP